MAEPSSSSPDLRLDTCDVADVVVVGGGPAGSTAASLIKRFAPARRVVLIERDPFPRHHVGESLLPESKRVLKKMGVLEKVDAAGYLRKGGITYRWNADRPLFSEEFARLGADGRAPEYSWQVDRGHYDALLLAHAASLGVEVWQPCGVHGFLVEGDRVLGVRVRRDGAEHTLRSGHVIDCSGQGRLLGRQLRIEQLPQDLGDLAVYRYYTGFHFDEAVLSSPALARIFFAATRAGWIWVIALSTELVSVGLVTRQEFAGERDLDDLFDAELSTVPEATAILRDATRVPSPWTESKGGPIRSERVKNWSYSHARTAGPGWFLAGDAAAFVNPILSSGVHVAHRSALNAVNALLTLWSEPDEDPTELYAAYSSFHRDLCSGFHEMARWWYHKRSAGIGDWWREANVLARKKGRVLFDDERAFMQFAAGYFSDFRFDKLGIGFGVEGLAVCFDAIEGPGVADSTWARATEERDVLRCEVVRVERRSHLATYVETDRWFRLPLLVFHLAASDAPVEYRPRVLLDAENRPLVERTLALLEAVLDAFDGVHGYADVNASLGVSGAEAPFAASMIADLTSLGVLRATGERSRVGRSAPEIADRAAPLRLAASAVRVVEGRGVALVTDGTRRAELEYESGGEPRRYRILGAEPALAGPLFTALLGAVDGRTGANDVVRRVRSTLGGDERRIHNLANIALSALLSLGVLEARRE